MCLRTMLYLLDYERDPRMLKDLARCCRSLLDHAHMIRPCPTVELTQALRKINTLAPATRSLSDEILEKIFKFTCPPMDFSWLAVCEGPIDHNEGYYSQETGLSTRPRKEGLDYCCLPLVLGAVSSHWRQVAWSIPELWTTLTVRPTCKTAEREATRLKLYMANAKGLAFALGLDLRAYYREIRSSGMKSFLSVRDVMESPNGSNLGSFMRVLFGETAGSIRTLRTAGTPGEWLPDITRKFVNVVDLSFGWSLSHPPGAGFFFQRFKSLHNLTPMNASPTKQTPLSYNITAIRLRSVNLECCIELLFHCTSLVEYYVRLPLCCPASKPIPMFLKAPFIRPMIKRFGWDRTEGNWNDALLQMIHLPNLEYLEWTGMPDEGPSEPNQAVIDFFSNLPLSLTSLALFGDPEVFLGYKQRVQLRDMFILLPQVEELILLKCCQDFIQGIFILLSYTGGNNDTAPTGFVFPKLREVRVCYPVPRTPSLCDDRDEEDNLWDGEDDYSDSEEVEIGRDRSNLGKVVLYSRFFMNAVRRRRRIIRISQFRFELSGFQLERARPVWRKLAHVVNRGFKLRVVEDSKLIDWSQPI